MLFKTQHLGDWILSPSSGGPTKLGSIDRASLLFPDRYGDRIQSPKGCVSNRRQDVGECPELW
jgi:hypothetical protein